jgi:hypothetical protein
MNRKDFPGAWYADSLPSGEFAVLFQRDRIETHLGRIALPLNDEPLYHRITNVGGFQLAGQGHFAGVTWYWTPNDGWVRKAPACGVSPVIFDALGFLHISDCSIGSQGYRYVAPNGQLISGDTTYGVRHGLNEWTDLSDAQDGSLLIGQEHDGAGAVLWDGSQRRMVEPGACRFIRACKRGDMVSVATWKEGFGAVVLWLTVAELRALPIVTQAQPAPAPAPKPVPTPEPKPVSTPNRLDIVNAVAGQHPELVKLNTKDACGQLTEYIALALHAADPGWGLLSKSAGENNYRGHAVDAVIYQPTQQVIDLMSGAGDRDLLTPQSTAQQRKDFDHDIRVKWSEVGKRAENNWMAPIQPDGSTPVPPPVVAPPVGDDFAALRNEVAALSVKLALLEADHRLLSEHLMSSALNLTDRMNALEQHPAAKSGDAVEVTGSVSLMDVYRGAKVTWAGKIK